MTIDSVVWAGTIRQHDRHTDSHVVIASALRRVAEIKRCKEELAFVTLCDWL